MFCIKCGNQLPDGAAFCGKCGAKVEAEPIVEQAATPVMPVAATPIAPTPQPAAASAQGTPVAATPQPATASAPGTPVAATTQAATLYGQGTSVQQSPVNGGYTKKVGKLMLIFAIISLALSMLAKAVNNGSIVNVIAGVVVCGLMILNAALYRKPKAFLLALPILCLLLFSIFNAVVMYDSVSGLLVVIWLAELIFFIFALLAYATRSTALKIISVIVIGLLTIYWSYNSINYIVSMSDVLGGLDEFIKTMYIKLTAAQAITFFYYLAFAAYWFISLLGIRKKTK